MRRNVRAGITGCVIGWLLVAASAAAQTNTGEISGVVRDAQGGVLPGATITAEHVESGARLARVTDEQGRYLLPSLRVGLYVITRGAGGVPPRGALGRDRRSSDRRSALDFALDVGGRDGRRSRSPPRPPLLQSANAEISDVIDNREVVQLPLNGRNFLALAQLSDAVVIPPGGTRGDALQQAGPLPNVGGQRSGHNIYLLDGVKVTDELFNNLVINPSVDSIQEFKIQKSQYPAEFGGKASALINVATRAGTQRLPRQPLRVPPPRPVRRAQLLRSPRPADSTAAAESVRRRARWSARARPQLLVRQLRRAARPPLADAHVLGSARRPSAAATSPASLRSAIR